MLEINIQNGNIYIEINYSKQGINAAIKELKELNEDFTLEVPTDKEALLAGIQDKSYHTISSGWVKYYLGEEILKKKTRYFRCIGHKSKGNAFYATHDGYIENIDITDDILNGKMKNDDMFYMLSKILGREFSICYLYYEDIYKETKKTDFIIEKSDQSYDRLYVEDKKEPPFTNIKLNILLNINRIGFSDNAVINTNNSFITVYGSEYKIKDFIIDRFK